MPSPSLSPSIHSLLNDDSTIPFNQDDYFGAPSTSTSTADSNNEVRPVKRPRTSSSSSPSLSFGTMNPPPPPPPPPPAHAPTSTSNVPPARPMSSSSSTSTSSLTTRQHAPRPPVAPVPPSNSLEPSIFNVEPIDEFTREVADWLWGFCAPLDWDKVEIEAKVGMLVDSRNGNQRVYLPVPTEAILTDDTGLRFQSNMTISQHKSFNQLLNARVVETSHSSYPHHKIAYSHTHELDTFHLASNNPGEKRKIRVTRNVDNKKPPTTTTNGGVNGATGGGKDWKAVEKVRVADMNVFSPKRWFDWRVSISLENPVLEFPPTPPTHSRRKDRISYSHQFYTIDLTQVTTPSTSGSAAGPNGTGPPTHELEVEIKDAKKLLIEAEKESRGEKNWYLQGVQGLLNNIRMLIRNASDP